MKRLLSVLCLFAMWVTPVHGETFSGFNQGPAYNLGWNLQWARNCNIGGYYDTISNLEKRAEEVLKGKELSLFEEGQKPRGGFASGCLEERVKKTADWAKWFLDKAERENASNNLKPSPTVTPTQKTYPKSSSTSGSVDIRNRLLKLKELEEEGLISKEDAARKRRELLDKL